MDSCIENPVSPCAMTGACAVLCGFDGLCVIIHGSSGCYYYPKSLLKVPMFSTYLLESEIIFGTVDRLHEVVKEVSKTGKPIAVLNTCIPALTGEDLRSAFSDENVIFVDAPGFLGSTQAGAKKAYEALNIKVDENRCGVNIDGVSLLDLFWRGNLYEAERILNKMQIPISVRFAKDSYANLQRGASPFTVSVNPSADSGVGKKLGSLLFPDLKNTVIRLSEKFEADAESVLNECHLADEQMFYSSDKFLRKYNAPNAAVFASDAYSDFSKAMLERYFGAEVTTFPRSKSYDLTKIKEVLDSSEFDLVLGSTFEANVSQSSAFFGITPPDRSRVSISARALSGVEGGIYFIESVLNAMIDFKKN
ncbi:MAG: nitrogenase component 1 [Methanocorpusculum sp.]|nr:nitrogenase component 1 [Methanocorpusculum sp.]